MPRFRSKPREISAEQWSPGKEVEGVHVTRGERGVDYGSGPDAGIASIRTRTGREHVLAGDWIVRGDGDDGGIDLYRPEDFAKAFEPIPADPWPEQRARYEASRPSL